MTPPPESVRCTLEADHVWHSDTVSSVYTLAPSPEPLPEVFMAFCYTTCTHRATNQHQVAEDALQRALKVMALMAQNFHEQLLACINTVSISLFMQRKGDEAVAVLESACCQCYNTDGNDANHSDVFRSGWGGRHPYTILAEYKLAWRLAMSETSIDEKVEALRKLSRIKDDADMALGPQDLLSIAIITTKARVLEALGDITEAERMMANSVRSMGTRYPLLHPYRLEIRSRHANLLRVTGQEYEAEQAFMEVALGRAEALGADHQYSKASKHDVFGFLDTGYRNQELQAFNEQYDRAIKRSKSRRPVFPW